MIESINRDRPGLYRIGAAASIAGLSQEAFAKACAAGSIPLQIVSIGPRLRYVRAEEFTRWLKGKTQ
jgi:hypothetical protein